MALHKLASAYPGTAAGAFAVNAYSAATDAYAYYSSPLCFFVDDPEIAV